MPVFSPGPGRERWLLHTLHSALQHSQTPEAGLVSGPGPGSHAQVPQPCQASGELCMTDSLSYLLAITGSKL